MYLLSLTWKNTKAICDLLVGDDHKFQERPMSSFPVVHERRKSDVACPSLAILRIIIWLDLLITICTVSFYLCELIADYADLITYNTAVRDVGGVEHGAAHGRTGIVLAGCLIVISHELRFKVFS